jgi:hypothetical protein
VTASLCSAIASEAAMSPAAEREMAAREAERRRVTEAKRWVSPPRAARACCLRLCTPCQHHTCVSACALLLPRPGSSKPSVATLWRRSSRADCSCRGCARARLTCRCSRHTGRRVQTTACTITTQRYARVEVRENVPAAGVTGVHALLQAYTQALSDLFASLDIS